MYIRTAARSAPYVEQVFRRNHLKATQTLVDMEMLQTYGTTCSRIPSNVHAWLFIIWGTHCILLWDIQLELADTNIFHLTKYVRASRQFELIKFSTPDTDSLLIVTCNTVGCVFQRRINIITKLFLTITVVSRETSRSSFRNDAQLYPSRTRRSRVYDPCLALFRSGFDGLNVFDRAGCRLGSVPVPSSGHRSTSLPAVIAYVYTSARPLEDTRYRYILGGSREESSTEQCFLKLDKNNCLNRSGRT